MKNGQLSKREMQTIESAWEILSKWTEWVEKDAEKHGYEPDTDYCYSVAMNAVCGLCEFTESYTD